MAQVAGGQKAESGLKLASWMDVVSPEKLRTGWPWPAEHD